MKIRVECHFRSDVRFAERASSKIPNESKLPAPPAKTDAEKASEAEKANAAKAKDADELSKAIRHARPDSSDCHLQHVFYFFLERGH